MQRLPRDDEGVRERRLRKPGRLHVGAKSGASGFGVRHTWWEGVSLGLGLGRTTNGGLAMHALGTRGVVAH